MTQVTNLQGFDFGKQPEGEELAMLHRHVTLLCSELRYLTNSGALKSSDGRGSFAVLVKIVDKDVHAADLIDDPNALFDFMCGWGKSAVFAANAVRKMRATARMGASTQEMRAYGMDNPTAYFDDVVGTDEDAELLWGEYPYGGAVIVEAKDGARLLVGVSGFTQEQDHWFSELVARFCILKREEAAATKKHLANPVPGAVG